MHLDRCHKVNIIEQQPTVIEPASISSELISFENVVEVDNEIISCLESGEYDDIVSNISSPASLNNLDDLKTKALLLSIEMSDLNSMPRKQVSKLQNMISTILVSIGQVLEAQLGESPNNEELQNLICFCKHPFQDIRSEFKLLATLRKLNLFRDAKTFKIDERVSEIVLQGNPTLGIQTDHIYIMPLVFIFQKIFEIPQLLKYSLQKIENISHECTMKSFINGNIFKNIVKRFLNKIVIPYILYFDDFEINNPLGGRTFPLCGCYISFPTFPSHLRSKVSFIFQIAFIS